MKKIAKKDFDVKSIEEQFQRLSSVTNTFTEKLQQMKQEQDEFANYMKSRRLFR
jgi:hypothetical protein